MRERVASDGTKTYQVLYRHGGKQSSKTFLDAKSARNFADLIRIKGVRRALVEMTRTDTTLTLDAVAQRFFDFQATRVRSPRTIHDYRRDYTNWIEPALGWLPIVDITEADVQDWVDSMRPRLSPKSIADRHALLHGIIKYALAPSRKLIDRDPCSLTELPKRVKAPPKGLHDGEWWALHAALMNIDPNAADLAEFLLASGWRFSEAIALDTHGVEVLDGRVYVTVHQVARRQADSSFEVVADAKSTAGKRRLKLDDDMGELVLRRCANLSPGDLVFATASGAMWDYGHFRSRFWAKAVKAAGLQRKPTIHWLRHSAVERFHRSGMSIPEIQRRIGHESIQTTIDVYGSLIDDATDDSLDKLAATRRPRLDASPVRAAIPATPRQDNAASDAEVVG